MDKCLGEVMFLTEQPVVYSWAPSDVMQHIVIMHIHAVIHTALKYKGAHHLSITWQINPHATVSWNPIS